MEIIDIPAACFDAVFGLGEVKGSVVKFAPVCRRTSCNACVPGLDRFGDCDDNAALGFGGAETACCFADGLVELVKIVIMGEVIVGEPLPIGFCCRIQDFSCRRIGVTGGLCHHA